MGTELSDEQKLIGKVLSTKGPALHLIPMEALVGLADRFEKGVERKGEGAWNALSANQECLVDTEFLLDRISHLITHALKFRDQLVRGVKPDEESMYDNAGAVAFGGALLLCAAKEVAFEAKVEPQPIPSEGWVRAGCPIKKDWSLQSGLSYATVSGYQTGPLIAFTSRVEQKRSFFEKNQSAVNWLWDGTPIRINMSLSDAQVEKFRIPYGVSGSTGV